MASRAILAGIKTAAVINVGTATIGALIGAGGFGQPILTGIRRDDLRDDPVRRRDPRGALLALAVQGLFDLAERFLVPAGTAAADQSTVRNWTQKYPVLDRTTAASSVKPAATVSRAKCSSEYLYESSVWIGSPASKANSGPRPAHCCSHG